MNPFSTLAAKERLYGTTVRSVETLRANPRRVAPDITRLFVAARTPITLWGPVGSRKTRTVEALAREKDVNGVNFQVVTIMPSTQDPTTIHGLMYVLPDGNDGAVMKRSVPDVAMQVVRYHEETDGYTILFADEMTTCMPAQQNAMLGLLTHGKFESVDISPLIAIVMAANPEGTVSTVNPLGEAVMNRGGHLAWYGDVDLFLDEWTTGFNGATQEPEALTKWYISNLLRENAEKAFRNERWDPDSLVPWDLMEHTERAVTETAKLITLVNETFADAPSAVRRFYVVQVTKAMLGIEWSGYMADLTARDEELAYPSTVVSKVREARITDATDEDELELLVGDTLHSVADDDGETAVLLTPDQRVGITEELVRRSMKEDGTFSKDTYLAAWAFVQTIGTEAEKGSHFPHLADLIRNGNKARQLGLLTKVIPAYVSKETQSNLREHIVSEARS